MTHANPYQRHELRRYSYGWEALQGRSGKHLDIGCGDGEFLNAVQATTELDCFGIDAHEGYLAEGRHAFPHLKLEHAPVGSVRLPYQDETFDSVTLLDTLEHVPDDEACLREIARVLMPDGIVAITVPRLHIFSILDPGNAKYRIPRIHRWIYSRRFGADVYYERFVDTSNGMRGDVAVQRNGHTNYRPSDLLAMLRSCGFEPTEVSGANLFWRFFHVPALLVRSERLRTLLERIIYWDGVFFQSANLHITARRLGKV